jgi:hypothetical protein
MVERLAIRILIAAILCAALSTFVLVPIPADANGQPDLPALALGQAGLYRLEVALLVFYSGLLLVTPAFLGVIGGRLPTEISTRGAKFTVKADQSEELHGAAIKELEHATEYLAEDLTAANLDIERLKRQIQRDNTKREVSSKHDGTRGEGASSQSCRGLEGL